MIAKMTSEQAALYRQQAAGMNDKDLAAELGQVAAELANIGAAMEELRQQDQELEKPDLSDVATAIAFLSKPAVVDNEAMQRARIVEYNLQKRHGILSHEKRGRDKRAAYGQVAAHALEHGEVLLQAAEIVARNQELAGRLAVPGFLPAFHPNVVKRALDQARAFVPK